MNSLVLTNTLEGVLLTAGYDDATLWARVLLDQVRGSTPDNTVIGLVFRALPVEWGRAALQTMPRETLALALARLVAFGFTESELLALVPIRREDAHDLA